ncbi:MAG: hypothetical protein Q9187_003782 [Circinaria calcarea]
MTILISDMSTTVVASYKRGTFTLADWTVLPKHGFFRTWLESHPWLLHQIQSRQQKRQEQKRLAEGFRIGFNDDDAPPLARTLEELADEDFLDEHDLARKLAVAIRRTADDLKSGAQRRYSYEEWVEFTRLIRFTRNTDTSLDVEEEEEGLIKWDWIGEDSPMMADQSESEWLLDRLCESLDRYMRKQAPEHMKRRRRSWVEVRQTGRRSGSRVEVEGKQSGGSRSGSRSRNGDEDEGEKERGKDMGKGESLS